MSSLDPDDTFTSVERAVSSAERAAWEALADRRGEPIRVEGQDAVADTPAQSTALMDATVAVHAALSALLAEPTIQSLTVPELREVYRNEPLQDGEDDADDMEWEEPEGAPGDTVRVGIFLDGPRDIDRILPDEWTKWSQDQRDVFIDESKRELLLSVDFQIDGAYYGRDAVLPPMR